MERIAIHVSASGVMVYLNRPALKTLGENIVKISNASPEDCSEIHIGSLFSYFDPLGALVGPKVTFSDDLSDTISKINSEALKVLVTNGEVPADAQMSPFEVTFMHISDKAIEEETARVDD
jgi:hypothetical protein